MADRLCVRLQSGIGGFVSPSWLSENCIRIRGLRIELLYMESKPDYYLRVLLVLLALYVLYWAYFGNYRYVNYVAGYYDMGVETYSLYWHVHGLNYFTSPLQYLVFTNHLSFFSLLLLPVFTLYQHPVTFLSLQAIALAATALAAYFISADLLKSRRVAFAFAIAFILNPGVMGLTLNDFHLESFTALFYLISFYFYMKKSVLRFSITFLLMLSLLEVEPFVGASMIAGLLLYQLLYDRKGLSNERGRMLAIGTALAALMFVVYYLLALYIPTTYANASAPYPIVPIQQLKNYLLEQTSTLISGNAHYDELFIYLGGAFGLIVFFLGFGLSTFFNPLLSIVLYSPWWLEVFFVHNMAFVYPYFQYYSFALGGSIASAILGLQLIFRDKGRRIGSDNWRTRFDYMVAMLIVICGLFVSLAALGFMNPALLLVNYAQQLNYTALDRAVGLIPANAGVMAQGQIAPHLFYVRDLELSQADSPLWFAPVGLRVYWFKPEYIIVSEHLEGYAKILNASPFSDKNFTAEYSVYFSMNGTSVFRSVRG